MHEPGAAQRQVADDAELLLELRGFTGIDRVVPGIVRSRGELVHEQTSVGGEEELDREHAHIVKCLGDADRDLAGLVEARVG